MVQTHSMLIIDIINYINWPIKRNDSEEEKIELDLSSGSKS